VLPEIRAVNIGSLERGFFYREFKSRVLEMTSQFIQGFLFIVFDMSDNDASGSFTCIVV
jgi:hypothetical protein